MIGVQPGRAAARTRTRPARACLVRATERESWIALSTLPGVGPASFTQLLRRHGSAGAAWRAVAAGADGPRGATGEPIARDGARVRDPRDVARAVEETTRGAGGRVVTWLDDEYPPALLTLDPRPPTLYVAGDARSLRARGVAVVGTRRATGYGLSVATEVADDLARSGVCVISGLALGVDGAAHRAAIAAGGGTIAVLPSPLDRVYPPRHRPLAREILGAGGALVTEVPTGSVAGRPDFARRNRIIAGLSEAVVVVEAPDRSGALLTAAAAVAIGRELYAVPGPIGSMSSRGCNRLIADQQATIVTSSGALLRQIGLALAHERPAVARLSEVEGQLLKRLLEHSASIEELIDRTSHPAAAVAAALTMLEARGLVDPFGGATFHPTLAARRLAKVP